MPGTMLSTSCAPERLDRLNMVVLSLPGLAPAHLI